MYDKNHLWVREEEEGIYVIGWTAYAVQNAGDISYVTLNKKGEKVKAGEDFGSIETGKWVGRLASPIEGEILDVNEEVVTNPDLVNETPYTDGWLLRIKATGERPTSLMGVNEYMEIVRSGKAF